jgi:N-acetylglucosamine-6-phosphate deacetylase
MGLLVSGARTITPGFDLGITDVYVAGNTIAAVGKGIPVSSDDIKIDASGLTLLPGFVDIHSHGRGGADFCDATDDAFNRIGIGKLADGVTSFLATGLTRP